MSSRRCLSRWGVNLVAALTGLSEHSKQRYSSLSSNQYWSCEWQLVLGIINRLGGRVKSVTCGRTNRFSPVALQGHTRSRRPTASEHRPLPTTDIVRSNRARTDHWRTFFAIPWIRIDASLASSSRKSGCLALACSPIWPSIHPDCVPAYLQAADCVPGAPVTR